MLLPDLARIEGEFPMVSFEFKNLRTRSVVEQIQAGSIDIGIAELRTMQEGIEARDLRHLARPRMPVRRLGSEVWYCSGHYWTSVGGVGRRSRLLGEVGEFPVAIPESLFKIDCKRVPGPLMS